MATYKDLPCGCKGIRFCAFCKDSYRVQNLNFRSDEYNNRRCFIYSISNQAAYHVPGLTSNALLEEIAGHANSSSLEEGEKLVIEGLLLLNDFISEDEERDLMEQIDRVEWAPSQSGRRKQDYGPQVNFKQKKVKTSKFVGMPEYADMLLEKMTEKGRGRLNDYIPLEMCNLEYDGARMSAIEMHKDDMWIWGNRLISINLLEGSVMTLASDEKNIMCFVLMGRRSLLCMADEARYKWRHAVFSHHIRSRRIALTMREPAPHFLPNGELFEKYGKELVRIAQQRVQLRS